MAFQDYIQLLLYVVCLIDVINCIRKRETNITTTTNIRTLCKENNICFTIKISILGDEKLSADNT